MKCFSPEGKAAILGALFIVVKHVLSQFSLINVQEKRSIKIRCGGKAGAQVGGELNKYLFLFLL